MTVAATYPGPDVGKRKKDRPAAQPADTGPASGRIELLADPEWIAELDRAAEELGLSRSAYIRMACNRQMAADRKARGDD